MRTASYLDAGAQDTTTEAFALETGVPQASDVTLSSVAVAALVLTVGALVAVMAPFVGATAAAVGYLIGRR